VLLLLLLLSFNKSVDPSSVLLRFYKFSQTFPYFTDAERSYRSDCETDDGISVANDSEYMNGSSSQQLTNSHSSKMKNRSPLAGRQSSPFPNEMTNRRMQQYNTAQERLRNGKLFVWRKATSTIHFYLLSLARSLARRRSTDRSEFINKQKAKSEQESVKNNKSKKSFLITNVIYHELLLSSSLFSQKRVVVLCCSGNVGLATS